MKSAVFYGKHDIRVEEWQKPAIGPQEILIRIRACGVCGTDVHIYDGDKGAAPCTPPTILGHEFSGDVVQVGEDTWGFEVGDRVSVDPNQTCGECYYCKNGLNHFCERMIGYGTTVNGGFAEYCAVHFKQAYKLGANTTYEQGAMGEPVACCLHGIDECEIKPGSVVAVIGGGMIGQIMLQLARLAGAHQVILLEPVAGKRETGLRLGASLTIDPINEDVQAVLKREHIYRIHTVIECVGKPSTVETAIQIAGNKSVVMLFGLTKPDEEITVKPFLLFQREIAIKASYINPLTQYRALSLIDSGILDVSSMICQVSPLEDLQEILANPQWRARGKYIIRP